MNFKHFDYTNTAYAVGLFGFNETPLLKNKTINNLYKYMIKSKKNTNMMYIK